MSICVFDKNQLRFVNLSLKSVEYARAFQPELLTEPCVKVSLYTALVIQSIRHCQLPVIEQFRIRLHNLTVLVYDPTDTSQLVHISDPLLDEGVQILEHFQHLVRIVLREVVDPAPDLWVQPEN